MSARIQSVPAGSSPDATVNGILDFSQKGFGDTQMFGLLARRPELLKRMAPIYAYFLAGDGSLIEPQLIELMRLRGAHLNACTYCATVRLQPIAAEIKPKEDAVGVTDISHMTKADAIAALRDRLDTNAFTPREAAALKLVDRIIVDAHTVDDALFAELRHHFSDDEIVELIVASSYFTLSGTLNIAVRLETGEDSIYGQQCAYATAG